MSMHLVCAWYLWRSEEDIRYPGARVMYYCEMSCGCWESNPGPLQKQELLTTETSLQTPDKVDHPFTIQSLKKLEIQ